VDGSRASFKNLSGFASMAVATQLTYQCESGDALCYQSL